MRDLLLQTSWLPIVERDRANIVGQGGSKGVVNYFVFPSILTICMAILSQAIMAIFNKMAIMATTA